MIALYGIGKFHSAKREYVVEYLKKQGCDVHQEYDRLMLNEDNGFSKLVKDIDNCGVEIKYDSY